MSIRDLPLFALLLFATPAAAEDVRTEGALCVRGVSAGSWSCKSAPAATADLGASDQARALVFVPADDSPVVAAVVPAGTTRLSEIPAGRVIVRIVPAEASRRLDLVTVDIESERGGNWRIDLPPLPAKRAFALDRGRYELVVSATRHQTIRVPIDVGEPPLDLGTRRLEPTPSIRGVVQTAGSGPLPGASISTVPAGVTVKSDSLGAFELEPGEAWPESLSLSYPGLATKVVSIPSARRSLSLPPIILSRGSRIAVRLVDEAAAATAAATAAELFRVMPDPGETKKIVQKEIAPQETAAAFSGLDAGEYVVVIRGREPLQRFAVPVTVGSEETVEREVRLLPFEVRISAVRGTTPFAGATVAAEPVAFPWRSEIALDDSGEFRGQMWQSGDYIFAMRPRPESPPFMTAVHVADQSSSVTLRLPESTIAGSVVDAETAHPIADARVSVESAYLDGSTGAFAVKSDQHGRFEIELVRAGTHVITADAETHLRSEPVARDVVRETERHEVAIRLERGREQRLSVVNAAGMPLPGATLIHAVGAATRVYSTDARGEAVLVAPAAPTLVVVVPAHGSLAAVRLPGSDSSPTMRVVVPDGTASLELRAVDGSGAGIAGIRFLMRLDGELIPPRVVQDLERLTRTRLYTDAEGRITFTGIPPGLYEFWPLRRSIDVDDVISSIGVSAPVGVAVKPGANSATITFRRAR